MKRLIAAAVICSLTTLAMAEKPYVPTFDPKRMSEEDKTLASDAFEGRGPDTPGETKTVDYVTRQFQAAGVQPGGDLKDGKRAWTQAVPLMRSEIVGTPAFSIDEGGTPRKLTQGEEISVRAALDGSASVALKNAPLVFCGYGVKATERSWDDFKGVDLHGKIMVVLVNDPDYETGQGDFGGKAMTYYGRWTYKFEEGARQGAAGVFVIHETDPASYGWATVRNSNTNAMFDIVRKDPKAAHTTVEAWIQRDLAVDLFKKSGLDFEALKKQAQTREFKPVQLKETFSAEFAVKGSVITSHNIVGRVDGTKRPDEVVIYSAHWDHLGIGPPDDKGDKIYNGAIDNATGTVALIELARAFAQGPKPDRTVIFLNVTAEEKGLLGSEYYAANPLYPLGKTVANVNMDSLDPNGPARNFSQSGSAKSDLLTLVIADAKAGGLYFSEDTHPESGSFFRSDHFSFAKRGVPALSFESGDDFVAGGKTAGLASRKEYIAHHYHQPADEWQADWSFAGMSHDLGIVYKIGSDLADSDQWPNWAKDSEFRAARDATAADRK